MAKRCSFCTEPAELNASGALPLCNRCARRLAALAVEESRAAASLIWDVRRETDEHPTLLSLREDVATQMPAEAYQERLALAEAYRQMGLHSDALREAGMSLAVVGAAREADLAITMLTTSPLLSANGMTHLRAKLGLRR